MTLSATKSADFNKVTNSERSEESLLIQNKGQRGILRPPRRAQNHGIPLFSATCYKLPSVVATKLKETFRPGLGASASRRQFWAFDTAQKAGEAPTRQKHGLCI
jgi:hypothetical protein